MELSPELRYCCNVYAASIISLSIEQRATNHHNRNSSSMSNSSSRTHRHNNNNSTCTSNNHSRLYNNRTGQRLPTNKASALLGYLLYA